ncbi:MAG TPA: aminotransferase class IV [Acidimicrobiales bacterium]|nr:aminotransferase class IV [Acidimicrobiales bacterium]
MDGSDQAVWLDGELVASAIARVSPFDHGMTVGDGVFETLKILRGTPFAARRHLGRLRRSAAGLGLAVPLDDAALRRAMQAVVDANEIELGRLRLTVTGGAGPLGSDRGAASPTVLVAAGLLPECERSTGVVTVPWPRNERGALAGLKSTSYAENVVALAHAHERGASEALFANTLGNLCEGTGTNVFVVVGGRLTTPPLTAGCLAGITRELVCELLGDRVDVTDVPMARLAEVEEAFLTSSTRDVQPIHSVDGRPLPTTAGPRTSEAATAFAELQARDLDP